ncbi:hypothetical protein [Photobacterium angustum]|nr:hypothetical protein [Photobacterium angustum]
MTQNYYFRKFQCGLTKKDTAKLCFKNVRTITRWDSGQPIPPECRRLMRITKGLELVTIDKKWDGWVLKGGKLINEQGISVSPEQILTGYALIEIGEETDRSTQRKIIKTARLLKNII